MKAKQKNKIFKFLSSNQNPNQHIVKKKQKNEHTNIVLWTIQWPCLKSFIYRRGYPGKAVIGIDS